MTSELALDASSGTRGRHARQSHPHVPPRGYSHSRQTWFVDRGMASSKHCRPLSMQLHRLGLLTRGGIRLNLGEDGAAGGRQLFATNNCVGGCNVGVGTGLRLRLQCRLLAVSAAFFRCSKFQGGGCDGCAGVRGSGFGCNGFVRGIAFRGGMLDSVANFGCSILALMIAAGFVTGLMHTVANALVFDGFGTSCAGLWLGLGGRAIARGGCGSASGGDSGRSRINHVADFAARTAAGAGCGSGIGFSIDATKAALHGARNVLSQNGYVVFDGRLLR